MTALLAVVQRRYDQLLLDLSRSVQQPTATATANATANATAATAHADLQDEFDKVRCGAHELSGSPCHARCQKHTRKHPLSPFVIDSICYLALS